MTTLLIARHGNTFGPGDVLRRVGAGTDLPLVDSGKAQARALGAFLKQKNLIPDAVYSGALQRVRQTAELALESLGVSVPVTETPLFNEIDYGPDEGKPEEDVIKRLGKDALTAWDQNAVAPDGWNVDPDQLVQNWLAFGKKMLTEHAGQTVLVVTSNGIARFAPHLTGAFEDFKSRHPLKLSTGAVAGLTFDGNTWDIDFWNVKPLEELAAA